PFIPNERLSRVMEEITENAGSSNIATLLGKGKDRLVSDAIRYCPECIKNDYQKYGEVYLHRQHQLSFITCCPEHGSKLITDCPGCNEKLSSAKDGKLLTSIECDCGCDLSECNEESTSNIFIEQRILTNFYQMVGYTYRNRISREDILIKLRNGLGLQGYMKYSGRTDRKQFFRSFECFLNDNGLREYTVTNLNTQVNSDSFF